VGEKSSDAQLCWRWSGIGVPWSKYADQPSSFWKQARSIHLSRLLHLWWFINLTRLKDAQIAGEKYFWVCLWGCLWKRLEFELVGWVKHIPPSPLWVCTAMSKLKDKIDQKSRRRQMWYVQVWTWTETYYPDQQLWFSNHWVWVCTRTTLVTFLGFQLANNRSWDFFFFFFFLWYWALRHSTSLFYCNFFFTMGSCKLVPKADFEPQSSWSLPPE
jgi:hypothetical protein